MNPKAEIFFDAITLLPEDMVEEAQEYRFRKSVSGWKKVGGLAACVMLILSVSLLAVMPRGCGASGGNSSSGGSNAAPPASADTAAPADEPREPLTGESAPGMTPDNGGDANSSAEDGSGQIGSVRFRAAVLEVNDDSILVEPLEGEELRNSYDRIIIDTRHLELPALAVGDQVRIAYDGWIVESDLPVITGVRAVELPEE